MSDITEIICQILKKSRYTVALSGFGMLVESGYPAIRDGGESYDIEQKYGYSTEEIFSSSFFRRVNRSFTISTEKKSFRLWIHRRGKDFMRWPGWRRWGFCRPLLPGVFSICPHVQDVKMSLSFMEMYTAIIVHIAARSILWSM